MTVGTTNFPASLDDAVSLPIPENNASSTLAAGINASALTITITDPSKFPDAGEFTLVDSLTAPTKRENVIIESRSGSDFTVEAGGRGAGGTTAQTWSSGAFIECRPNKLYYTALRSAILEIEAKLGTGNLIDASQLADGSVSNTELQYLNGVTSSIQTQLDAKQAAFTSQNANVVYAGPTSGGAAAPGFRALVAGDIPDLSASYSVVGHNHSGVYEPANANIQSHIASTSNPHSVTKSQVGLGNVEDTALSTWAGSSNITTLGTVTTGTLSTGTVIGGVTMTLGTDGTGDIYYRSAGGVLMRLAAGTDGHVLTLASGLPSWAAASGGGLTIGTTAIASGTAGRILYETAGNVLGEIAGSSADANGAVQFAASARTSGVAQYFRVNTPADTTLTASTESVGVYIGGDGSGSTVTRQWAAGALTTQRENVFVAPTYAFVGSSTITDAITVSISNWPQLGTNAAATRQMSLGFPTATNPSSATGIVKYHIGEIGQYAGILFSGARIYLSSNGRKDLMIYDTTIYTTDGMDIGWSSNPGVSSANLAITRAASGVLRVSDGGTGAGQFIVGSSSASTTAAQLYAVSGSASRVGLRVDSAASPSVDIQQWTINGTQTAAVDSAGNFYAGGASSANGTLIGSVSGYAGVWMKQSSPSLSNYAMLFDGVNNIFGATGSIIFRTNNGTPDSRFNGVTWQFRSNTDGSAALFDVMKRQSGTAATNDGYTWGMNSTGTPAAGFGGAFLFNLESTTTEDQNAARMKWLWGTATHASRSAAIAFDIVDNAASLREAFRIAGNGSGTGTALTQTNVNGATTIQGQITENITLNTGGTTTDSTIDLPANSIILSVTARITTTITTATDWTVGDPTTADRFSDANSTLTAGTTSVGINQWKADRTTAGQGPYQASTAKVRVTTTNIPDAGAIRITAHYITLTAPTS